MDVSENSGTPKSSHFNRVFHYKPSILGYPYFWKHPYNRCNPKRPHLFSPREVSGLRGLGKKHEYSLTPWRCLWISSKTNMAGWKNHHLSIRVVSSNGCFSIVMLPCYPPPPPKINMSPEKAEKGQFPKGHFIFPNYKDSQGALCSFLFRWAIFVVKHRGLVWMSVQPIGSK